MLKFAILLALMAPACADRLSFTDHEGKQHEINNVPQHICKMAIEYSKGQLSVADRVGLAKSTRASAMARATVGSQVETPRVQAARMIISGVINSATCQEE